MIKSIFSAPHFNDEAAAYAYVEARLWANGRPCPHCGIFDRSGALKAKGDRIGLYKCYACRKPFTVKIGTIFEKSHIQMRDWLYAIHMICSSKKGVSANQLHRTLGITLKSAWFMGHRIREAMRSGELSPMGGVGDIVESDETFIGRKEGSIKRRGHGHKNAVLSLVDRKSGQVVHFPRDETVEERAGRLDFLESLAAKAGIAPLLFYLREFALDIGHAILASPNPVKDLDCILHGQPKKGQPKRCFRESIEIAVDVEKLHAAGMTLTKSYETVANTLGKTQSFTSNAVRMIRGRVMKDSATASLVRLIVSGVVEF